MAIGFSLTIFNLTLHKTRGPTCYYKQLGPLYYVDKAIRIATKYEPDLLRERTSYFRASH